MIFISADIFFIGLCDLTLNPQSMGVWTVYQEPYKGNFFVLTVINCIQVSFLIVYKVYE